MYTGGNYTKQDSVSITEHCGAFAECLYLSYPNSLLQFYSKRAHLFRFNVSGNNRTYLGRHLKFIQFQPHLDFLDRVS